jgi:hypothetical protein
MGCFDSVMVPCPRCGTRNEAQSKSGDCLLRVFNLEECPQDVLVDVNRHAPLLCDKCGAAYCVKFLATPTLMPRDNDCEQASATPYLYMGPPRGLNDG